MMIDGVPPQMLAGGLSTCVVSFDQQLFDFVGTVGWARTTDLLFHRQAL